MFLRKEHPDRALKGVSIGTSKGTMKVTIEETTEGITESSGWRRREGYRERTSLSIGLLFVVFVLFIESRFGVALFD